jgi:hypothetical protein
MTSLRTVLIGAHRMLDATVRILTVLMRLMCQFMASPELFFFS